ncbi:MAG: hypothetical protein OSB19_02050 [Opitutaceae bacterium]|nr:hypothetical protein [Opitutaceae bacterium]
MNRYVCVSGHARRHGIGGLLVAVVGLTLPVLLVYFLYQRKIFIRLWNPLVS